MCAQNKWANLDVVFRVFVRAEDCCSLFDYLKKKTHKLNKNSLNEFDQN